MFEHILKGRSYMTRYRIYLFVTPLLLVSIVAVIMAFMPGLTRAASGGFYQQTNLVSDIPGMAKFTDPNLKNPWGISHSSGSPWWVSDNNAGVATLYRGDGTPQSLVVNIPLPGDPTGGGTPTGNVFNIDANSTDFVVSNGVTSGRSIFIFATEDGTISGWAPNVDPTHAIIAVDYSGSGAVYKGLAIAHSASGDFLYATNFHDGVVEMYDSTFTKVKSFTDKNLSNNCPLPGQCFAPFGIQVLGGKLYVTYALQKPGGHDDQAGRGNGFVDVFDLDGNFIQRLASGGKLDSPWGLAVAPLSFGGFGGDLLVGNFGDGRINAFDPATGDFLGQLKSQDGKRITIDGLWALGVGNDGAAGPSSTLFFTAGINDEADGLFGSITPIT
jgi:uncharacterized protein (TIGR03118 family)